MGSYLNPPDMTKEEWLKKNAKQIAEPPKTLTELAEGQALVCWVHNGIFTACAHVYDERELREFSRDDDRRPKAWFTVDSELAKAMFR